LASTFLGNERETQRLWTGLSRRRRARHQTGGAATTDTVISLEQYNHSARAQQTWSAMQTRYITAYVVTFVTFDDNGKIIQ